MSILAPVPIQPLRCFAHLEADRPRSAGWPIELIFTFARRLPRPSWTWPLRCWRRPIGIWLRTSWTRPTRRPGPCRAGGDAPPAEAAPKPAKKKRSKAKPAKETTETTASDPEKGERLRDLSVEELQAKYLEIVGRQTGSVASHSLTVTNFLDSNGGVCPMPAWCRRPLWTGSPTGDTIPISGK